MLFIEKPLLKPVNFLIICNSNISSCLLDQPTNKELKLRKKEVEILTIKSITEYKERDIKN